MLNKLIHFALAKHPISARMPKPKAAWASAGILVLISWFSHGEEIPSQVENFRQKLEPELQNFKKTLADDIDLKSPGVFAYTKYIGEITSQTRWAVTLSIGETKERHSRSTYINALLDDTGNILFQTPNFDSSDFAEESVFYKIAFTEITSSIPLVLLESSNSQISGRVKVYEGFGDTSRLLIDSDNLLPHSDDHYESAMFYFADIDDDGSKEISVNRRIHQLLDGGERFLNQKIIYKIDPENGALLDVTRSYESRLKSIFERLKRDNNLLKMELQPWTPLSEKTTRNHANLGEAILPTEEKYRDTQYAVTAAPDIIGSGQSSLPQIESPPVQSPVNLAMNTSGHYVREIFQRHASAIISVLSVLIFGVVAFVVFIKRRRR